MSRDALEALSNAVAGFGLSVAMVALLRASGGWETLSAPVVAGLFFALSVARSYALRRLFREFGHAG